MSFNSENLRKRFLLSQAGKRHSKVKLFIKSFQPSDIALDIDCGSGVELKEVSKIVKYSIGIDIDEDVLKIAKTRCDKNINLVRCDALLLPFRPRYFSKIICLDVLEHLILPGILISEFSEILKWYGKLIIRIPNKWTSHEILLMVISPITKIKKGIWHVCHVYFFDAKSIVTMLNSFDFEYLIRYICGDLLFNITTIILTLASIISNIIILDPIKREIVLSRLRQSPLKLRALII